MLYCALVSPYSTRRGIRDKEKSLLLVSKKIGLEALEVLYGENIFHTSLYGATDYEWEASFNRRRIRMVQILMQPPDNFHNCKPYSTIFLSILANLNKLTVVVQQPREAQSFYIGTSEQDLQEWVDWLRDNLQYVAGQLPNSCIVEVDDDDRRVTSTVMRECFPSGYRKVQTVLGDEYFMRKDFSIESNLRMTAKTNGMTLAPTVPDSG